MYPSTKRFPSTTLYPGRPAHITPPTNVRGPILRLELPVAAVPIKIVLKNETTGKSLALNLAGEGAGGELVLDFFRRTITDSGGEDRSALLDAEDNSLWTSEPLVGGIANVITLAATRGRRRAKKNRR